MNTPYYQDDSVRVFHGDCIEVLNYDELGYDYRLGYGTTRAFPDNSVDAVVTDPPYGLEFMGKEWDGADGFRRSLNAADASRDSVFGRTSRTSPEYRADNSFQQWCTAWATECLRVLKPGGHLLSFGGSRTWHRLAAAVEDSGFEIRDSIAWLYGSGFPKSLDVAKAIDKAAGYIGDVTGTETVDAGMQGGHMHTGRDRNLITREVRSLSTNAEPWRGWGTALKPSFEPIVVGRKPLAGNVATNVLAHGVGALNIDACRVLGQARPFIGGTARSGGIMGSSSERGPWEPNEQGRWPTNVVLDEHQAAELDAQSGTLKSGANPTRRGSDKFRNAYGDFAGQTECVAHRGADEGGASRFFPTFRYEAKASTEERPVVDGVAHPTVKPLDLMRWLVRLVTPPGGLVLEPFAGSGTTAEACIHEHMRCIAIEREDDYLPLIMARLTKPIEVGFDFNEAAI